MPISSLIAQTLSGRTSAVAARVGEIRGAEVVHVDGAQIVIVTESLDRSDDERIFETIRTMQDVSKLDLVYHNFEKFEGAEQ